ncbi:MAG: hypothetical protein K6T65_14315 [Peptococcaceae bacterium]|nr:hypothetical protein [Peptococcaceae bacterium]
MIEIINGYIFETTKEDDEKFITINTGPSRKIKVSCEKINVIAREQTTILFTYQKYNIDTKSWENDNEANEPITVLVNNDKLELTPLNGADSLIFSSDEPGVFLIKTDNVNIRNTSVSVEVTSGA